MVGVMCHFDISFVSSDLFGQGAESDEGDLFSGGTFGKRKATKTMFDDSDEEVRVELDSFEIIYIY